MRKNERWQVILDLLTEKQNISVEEVTELTGMSQATIRRDLQEMEDQHFIERYYGGARRNPESQAILPTFLKMSTNADEKNAIARVASRYIRDDQMIYLDSGSSVYNMINYITARNITVVTNSVGHIPELSRRQIRTIMLGGIVDWNNNGTSGAQAEEQLEYFYFDHAFFGTNGIHKNAGITSSGESRATLKREIIARSANSFVLADSSKFGMLFPYPWSDGRDVTVITDVMPDEYAELPIIYVEASNMIQPQTERVQHDESEDLYD